MSSVGIARAFAIRPSRYRTSPGALDALDPEARFRTSRWVMCGHAPDRVHDHHDVDEAILLADRIILMTNGRRRDAQRLCTRWYRRSGPQHAAWAHRTRAELHH
jgi:ABC-type nitrate/sulfonate/bicarbonate transport system ATPase subunit